MNKGSLEDWESVLMNSSIGIHFVNKDGVIIYANQFELEMLDYEHDEYVGHHIREFQVDTHILDDMLMRLTNHEYLSNYPSRVQAKDSIKYLLYNSNIFFMQDEFIHTRCFSSEIDPGTFKVFVENSGYFQ